jgi:hypothetical protein
MVVLENRESEAPRDQLRQKMIARRPIPPTGRSASRQVDTLVRCKHSNYLLKSMSSIPQKMPVWDSFWLV